MATGKEIRDRVFAMSGAILFLVSACALTVAVIVSSIQDSKKTDATAVAQQVKESNANKLEGTKLEGFTPVAEVSEVQTTDLKVGTGKEVTTSDQKITVDYTGALASDGTIFQSSLDTGQPFETTLGGVIKGWQTGVIGMKEGGKRLVVIPAADAYGEQSQGNIPANSNLVFEITLHKVQ